VTADKRAMTAFAESAQSLKLYRRAELRDDADEPLIERLYVDPLQNDAVLETMLRPNTTFVIGRKGTGKSTVFQRAQHEIRKKKRALSAYVDIKTVFESASVDPEVGQTLSSLGSAASDNDIKRILLYRAFTRAVFLDIQKELRAQISSSFLSKVREAFTPQRNEVIGAIDDLLEGAFEAEVTDVTAAFGTSVSSSTGAKSTSKETSGTIHKAGASTKAASFSLESARGWEVGSEHNAEEAHAYSKVLLRTFNVNAIMERLAAILETIGVKHLYIFIDDFSELPQEAMDVFVDTVLAPLNNWSNELIKFKVAAYPGRVYLGRIDSTKIDEIYLDTYRLYGLSDVATMEEKAIDFTRRLLNSRFSHFLGRDFDEFCDSDPAEVYRQLFYATMGNPRILGHILHNLRESHIAYGSRIGTRAIQDAAARYYEEKIEPYFGIQKFVHEAFGERSSVFSLKELLESVVLRARELRDYKESTVTRELQGRTPSSHFHVVAELDSLLSTLELNFFVTKFYEMKDRDGRKVSIYALNYGLCARHTISFGRPSGKREHRLYFVERIFDYTPILRRYLQRNQEIRCSGCAVVHGLDKLESLKLFDMMCPSCKSAKCEVVNLSRKYEHILNEIDEDLLLPPTELGILETLYLDPDGMAAGEIAGELDCSYQLIGKRAKILAERGLVDRDTYERGRRLLTITERARDDYFEHNEDRRLDVPGDDRGDDPDEISRA
jgi:DNA-binding MarR family transcriptional regulator